MPSLTPAGWWLLVGGCATLIFGVALSSTEWLAWTAMAWTPIALAYFAMLAAMRGVERGDIAIALSDERGHNNIATTRGQSTPLRLTLHNRLPRALFAVGLRVAGPAGIEFDDVQPAPRATIGSGARWERAISIDAARTGRWVLREIHVTATDLLGLVVLRMVRHADFVITVLPDPQGAFGAARSAQRSDAPPWMQGADSAARPGDGSELRELRPYTSSDAFSRIAWKATARTGQLMVREHEDDIPGIAVAVTDVSSSMRGGEGALRLEYALGVAAAVVAASRRARDRCGLVSFDDQVVGAVAPAVGHRHELRLAQHLVAVATAPTSGVVDSDDDALAGVVGNWARQSLRLDFRTRRARSALFGNEAHEIDDSLLQRWIATRRRSLTETYRNELADAGIDTADWSPLRLLIGAEGIDTGLRSTPRFGAKDSALAAAIDAAAALCPSPALITVCTDLCAMLDPAPACQAMQRALARRHQIAVIVPFVPEFVAARDNEAAVRDAFVFAERSERQRLVRAVRAAGASVLVVGPELAPAAAVAALGGSTRRLRRP